MEELLTLIVILGLVATMISLLLGIGSMNRGGEVDEKYSTKLMFARVGAQAFTIVILLFALYIMHG